MRPAQSALVVLFTTASARSLGSRNYEYVPMPCAVSGNDTTTSYLYTSSDDNYPDCSAACLSRSDCTGLSIDDSQCKLYSIPMESAYTWNSDSNTTFWDIRCQTQYIQCEAPGYQADWDDFWWSANMTLQDCKAACKEAKKFCLSYSFGNGECSLYEIPVSGSVDPETFSPYLFYDALCDADSSVESSTASVPTAATVTATATNLVPVATNTISAAVTSLAARNGLVARAKDTTTTTKTTTAKKGKTTVSYSERVVAATAKSSSSKTTTTQVDTVRLVAAVATTKSSTTTTTTTTTKPTTTTTTTTTKITTTPITTTTTSTTRPLVSLTSTTTSKTTTAGGKTTKVRMTVDWGANGQFIKTIGPQQSQQAGVID